MRQHLSRRRRHGGTGRRSGLACGRSHIIGLHEERNRKRSNVAQQHEVDNSVNNKRIAMRTGARELDMPTTLRTLIRLRHAVSVLQAGVRAGCHDARHRGGGIDSIRTEIGILARSMLDVLTALFIAVVWKTWCGTRSATGLQRRYPHRLHRR